MKKSIAVVIALALLLSGSAAAYAYASAGNYVYDHNQKLSAAEISELDDRADDVYGLYGFDILIDMDDSVTENAISYAERRYAEVEGARNGILLVITADKWYVHLEGEALNVFSDSHMEYLWEAYDVERTYYDGVAAYILTAEVILELHYGGDGGVVTVNPAIPEARQKSRLVDDAGLLTASTGAALLAKLDEISERQGCDVAIVTVNSLSGKTAEAYADDYYDYNGYGMGSGDDGILLLISMADRDWAITTYGFATAAFTDAGQAYIVDEFIDDLSAGNYAAAFTRFAGLCDDFLTQAKSGEPYDRGNLPDTVGFWMFFGSTWIVLLPVGFVLSLMITGIMKRKMKSVVKQKAANSYVREGSLYISDTRDDFLYKTTNKTPRETSSSSSGGSSTHRSSSGRSHGGSSGKF